MREEAGAEHDEWVRRLRELARRDAEEMVPRPDFPVAGLAAPWLGPAALASYGQVNGSWTEVTLAYGSWESAAGPYVAVTSAVVDPDVAELTAGAPGHGPEAELLRAIDAERNRVAAHAGVDEEEPAHPPRYVRQVLPAGPALVCRHGTVWAARLDGSPAGAGAGTDPSGVPPEGTVTRTGRSGGQKAGRPDLTVTITGRGVEPAAIRLAAVPDLRPAFEARGEILGRLAERRREPPVLEPAEGVAAFRALAEFSIEGQARIRAAAEARRLPRRPADWGRMHGALWQRAVSEQQRIAGVDKTAANDVVTSVINHLGHLAEQAPWFTVDSRLREAAIDETLRHAVLGDAVPSLPAQQAWARYWSDHMDRGFRAQAPAAPLADMAARQSLTAGWLAAWEAWAASA